MTTHRKQLDEYCSEVRSDWCCRYKVMYGNSKNVIAMSQSAILLSLEAEWEFSRTLNPAVCISTTPYDCTYWYAVASAASKTAGSCSVYALEECTFLSYSSKSDLHSTNNGPKLGVMVPVACTRMLLVRRIELAGLPALGGYGIWGP